MSRVLTFVIASFALVPLAVSVAAPATAAVRKKPVRRPAKKSVVKPAPRPAPGLIAGPARYMTPKPVTMRSMTPAEALAHAAWSVRAALNVAALQCQYSRFLDTRNTYNALLTHHSDELQQAQRGVLAHFNRLDKARGAQSFDRYNTQTYNSFSTLDAQYSFCEAAADVGKRELAQPKGAMSTLAPAAVLQLRTALAWQPLAPALAVRAIDFSDVPRIDAVSAESGTP